MVRMSDKTGKGDRAKKYLAKRPASAGLMNIIFRKKWSILYG
jgi:hypothetical protein